MAGNASLQRYLTRDLYTYCSEGLGFTLFPQPHREMCRAFESVLPPLSPTSKDEQRYFAYGAPRETLKTSIGAQGLAEYYLLKAKVEAGYDGRVLIVRAAAGDATTVVSAQREDLSGTNPVIARAFGDLSGPLWTKEAITLCNRATSYREPSIDTASIGVSKTGYHYDLVILDDLTNETNYTSTAIMQQARRYIQSLFPVLNNWGTMIHIGTRWSEADTTGYILETNSRSVEAGKPEPWTVNIWGAYLDDGTLFYPAHLTEKRLEQKRSVLESKFFSSQYLNQVVDDESRVFRPEYLRYFEGTFTPRLVGYSPATLEVTEGKYQEREFPVTVSIHVDPATSVSEKANYTAINVVMYDGERRWVYESYKNREAPSVTIIRLCNLAARFDPEQISIDVLGQQVLWLDLLKAGLEKVGMGHVRITQYRGKDDKVGRGILSKARRIEGGLEPLFRSGGILVRRGACAPMLNEYRTYEGPTDLNHYDALDSLSHTSTIYLKPKTMDKIKDEQAFKEWRMEYDDEAGPKETRWVKGNWAGA